MSDNSSCPVTYHCSAQGTVLPLVNESNWSDGFRATIYLVGLLWSFMAVALIADIFMCAIEVITSKTTEVKIAKPGTQQGFQIVHVRVWNDTVANLTLMALGSSTPEILLSIIEVFTNNFKAGELGPGTIVGSAAFNLFVIVAVCVVGIPKGEVKKIDRMKVFVTTALFSLFAYFWIVVVLLLNTPNEVDLWEAVVTFLLLPLLIVLAFMADKNYCMGQPVKSNQMEIELGNLNENSALMKIHKTDEMRMAEIVTTFMKNVDLPENISEEEASAIAASKLEEKKTHSRAWYRVQASRNMLAGRPVVPTLNDGLRKIFNASGSKNGLKEALEERETNARTEIEFETVSCSVMENCGSVKLNITRRGDLEVHAAVKFETIDGTAVAGEDYSYVKGVVEFAPKETKKHIIIMIIDDDVWEPDETFFVKLSVLESRGNYINYVKLGKKSIMQITIINDDEPGTVEFTKPSYLVKESVGTAQMPLQRFSGADGIVEVEWETTNLSGKEGEHYIGKSGVVIFQHGECEKNIEIPIVNDHATIKEENFQITLTKVSSGAKLGKTQKTIVTVVGDDEFDGLVRRVIAKTHLKLQNLKLGSQSWAEQFKAAMQVNGGDIQNATVLDYFMHFFTFGFKVIFAIVPPPSIWGGWACFGTALLFITILTVLIKDLASIFGCLISLKPTVNAITLVALGTSLPDLFASKTAAIQEQHADNCIGNVTGSNSVNVFLGLGLPWLIAAVYWKVKADKSFHVPAAELGFSVTLYSICAVICLFTLILRRYLGFFGKTELGGPTVPKYLTGLFFVMLWLTYVVVSSLKAYDLIETQF